LIAVCVALSLAAPFSFGTEPAKVAAQARLVDHAEILCDNCAFGPSDYYYCFAVDNQMLIARQRTPVLNWRDSSKNYLTDVHRSWAAWTAPGETIPISYDDKYIWISRSDTSPVAQGFFEHVKSFVNWASRGNRKQVKLSRSSMRDIFSNACSPTAAPLAH
jgi:hypothetical protein